ncbi:MAG TPA: RagB/SusD family nutrient uptake outer membrane protein, partial [Fodinibius sp.]|nr:RagB/SusD family nutrient uptake outer membrane protein [Fodinibius sp.]
NNQERWERAYTANREAKQLLDQDGYGLYEDFGQLFIEEGNRSVIFARLFSSQADRVHGWEQSVRPPAVQGGGSVNPTFELVNAFPMENGLSIDNVASGYDSTLFYKNRDPRFYETIAFNGATWSFNGYPEDRRQWHYYVDGSTVEPSGGTNTGFYCRKAVDPSIPTEEISETGTDWVEIRYAEVLMNLAETANATGRQQEAYNQLIAIRDRAGIDPGANSMYGLQPGMGRQQMVDAIMKERQIEFAFENKRYWDLRRRNLFEEKLNGTSRHGLRINLKPEVSADDFRAARDTISLDRAYEDYFEGELLTLDQDQLINYPQPKYNFFAIPPEILQRSPEVEQTQGWDNGTFDPLQ